MVVALQNVDEHRESLDDVRRRERIWDENAYGWHGYLTNLLGDVSGTYGDNYRLVGNTILPRKQAITRLLILELAVRCYQLEHDILPEKLEQLVPNILAQLPTDPFDGNNRPLSFLRTADGYVLYSVGPNGVDDGGTACAKDGNPGMPETGDLRIDTYFAEIDENRNQLPDENSNDSNNIDDAHSTADRGDK